MSRVFGILEIRKKLPLRTPYYMLDRAEVTGNGEAKGYKLVSGNETFFCGHFPDQAIMPGVLQVESMFQLAVLSLNTEVLKPFLSHAKSIKFRKPVLPGDRLDIEVSLVSSEEGTFTFKAKTSVNGAVTCTAGFSIIDLPSEKLVTPETLLPSVFIYEGRQAWMDYDEIKKHIPHRYPFLLVDRILENVSEIDEKGQTTDYSVCLKNISANENFFHFSGENNPYLPNFMQLEIAAQIGCAVVLSKPENKEKIGLYMGVDEATFYHPVLPGDELIVKNTAPPARGNFGKGESRMYVGDRLVGEVRLKFALVDKQD
ncbi:MAG: hypothetical protein MK193_03190 [Lentisphaeria bacterium]|nr:hypothetical protein [Lentisphaeria bacterium]